MEDWWVNEIKIDVVGVSFRGLGNHVLVVSSREIQISQ